MTMSENGSKAARIFTSADDANANKPADLKVDLFEVTHPDKPTRYVWAFVGSGATDLVARQDGYKASKYGSAARSKLNVKPGETFTREYKGRTFTLTVLDDGRFELSGFENGHRDAFDSPTAAAKAVLFAETGKDASVNGVDWWGLGDRKAPPTADNLAAKAKALSDEEKAKLLALLTGGAAPQPAKDESPKGKGKKGKGRAE
jgi:hypothetical protein